MDGQTYYGVVGACMWVNGLNDEWTNMRAGMETDRWME